MKKGNFNLCGNWIVLHERETFSRTASGKAWRRKPDAVTREVITESDYSRFVNSISFFNGWGDGAYCRAESTYTKAGYIPTKIVTVSPFKQARTVDRFYFIPVSDLYMNAGMWERAIVDGAESWEMEFAERGIEVTFWKPTRYEGMTDGATYCTIGNAWI